MRRPTRTILFRVGATLALVVIARWGFGHGHRQAVPPSGLQPSMATPAGVGGGPPREPATAAARRILATYATYPSLPLAEAEASLRGLTTIGAMDRLVGQLDADLARLAEGYPGGPTRLWQGFLASRETGADLYARRVEVWFARVVAPPAAPVYVEWRLATLDLRWERDGWRLDDIDETEGPRPLSLPGSADRAEAILAAVDGFVAEAS